MVKYFKGWNLAQQEEISQAESLMEDRYCTYVLEPGMKLTYKEDYLNKLLVGIDYYVKDSSELSKAIDFHKFRCINLKFNVILPVISMEQTEIQFFIEYDENSNFERQVKSITNNEKKYIKEISYDIKNVRLNSCVYLMNADGSFSYVFEYNEKRICVDVYSFLNQESIPPNGLLVTSDLKKYYYDDLDD